MILRHTELAAYRCFLPDLAGFTGFYCTGPSPYFRSSRLRKNSICVLRQAQHERKTSAYSMTAPFVLRFSKDERSGFRSLLDPSTASTLQISICPQKLRHSDKERAVYTKCGLAERVGFEPTVPLPGRMLSKHVDSSTLAPLRTYTREAAS